jgi:glycosyltransferase involved in cell wall biosynthesis
MIATLKDFKGIPEYVRLAAALTHFENIHFELLINDNQLAIDTYFQNRLIPLNMTIFPKTRSTSKFYSRSSLVLNLSRTDMWVETFGLTVLEAMAFGIPVIAPPVGGPAELLTHGKHGFLIDSRDFTKLQEAVLKLSEDATLCYRMSKACLERASAFSPIIFKDQIIQAVRSI